MAFVLYRLGSKWNREVLAPLHLGGRLELASLREADRLVGGLKARLVVGDTAMPKEGPAPGAGAPR